MTFKTIDRRALFGFAGAGAASLLLFGRSSGAATNLHFAVNRTDAQWKQILGPERYHILREAGTERRFTSPLLDEHRRGTFVCAGCALPLARPNSSKPAAPAPAKPKNARRSIVLVMLCLSCRHYREQLRAACAAGCAAS